MRSLVAKFTVMTGVMLLASTLVLIGLNYFTIAEQNREESRLRAELTAELFARSLGEAMARENDGTKEVRFKRS